MAGVEKYRANLALWRRRASQVAESSPRAAADAAGFCLDDTGPSAEERRRREGGVWQPKMKKHPEVDDSIFPFETDQKEVAPQKNDSCMCDVDADGWAQGNSGNAWREGRA